MQVRPYGYGGSATAVPNCQTATFTTDAMLTLQFPYHEGFEQGDGGWKVYSEFSLEIFVENSEHRIFLDFNVDGNPSWQLGVPNKASIKNPIGSPSNKAWVDIS